MLMFRCYFFVLLVIVVPVVCRDFMFFQFCYIVFFVTSSLAIISVRETENTYMFACVRMCMF